MIYEDIMGDHERFPPMVIRPEDPYVADNGKPFEKTVIHDILRYWVKATHPVTDCGPRDGQLEGGVQLKCKGLTKLGVKCKAHAVEGGYCSKHQDQGPAENFTPEWWKAQRDKRVRHSGGRL